MNYLENATIPQGTYSIPFELLNTLLGFESKAYPKARFYLPTTQKGLRICYDEKHLCGNTQLLLGNFFSQFSRKNMTSEQFSARFNTYLQANFRPASNYDLVRYGFYYTYEKKTIEYEAIDPVCCNEYLKSLCPKKADAVKSVPDYPDLRSMRNAFGLTQEAFAAHLGMPTKTYIKWEKGEHEVKSYVFRWIKEYCLHNPPKK